MSSVNIQPRRQSLRVLIATVTGHTGEGLALGTAASLDRNTTHATSLDPSTANQLGNKVRQAHRH